MYRICFLVLLVSSCSAARRPGPRFTARARSALRIYKGYPDTAAKYSYVVALLSPRGRLCTGTLISPNWVLTASHCIIDGLTIGIQYGNMSLAHFESTTKSRILKMFVHPTYMSDDFDHIKNNIGLLKVETVHLRVYGNVSALDYRTLTGRAVEYAGYGATHNDETENREQVSDMDKRRPVQWGEGVVVSCGFNSQFLCVAPKCSNKEQDTLGGDSGAPLFYDGKIVGVLMGGLNLPISEYTGVSSFLSWINSVMSKESF